MARGRPNVLGPGRGREGQAAQRQADGQLAAPRAHMAAACRLLPFCPGLVRAAGEGPVLDSVRLCPAGRRRAGEPDPRGRPGRLHDALGTGARDAGSASLSLLMRACSAPLSHDLLAVCTRHLCALKAGNLMQRVISASCV